MHGFKQWLNENGTANGPVPSNQLEQKYLSMMLQQYKPQTIQSLYAATKNKFFQPAFMFEKMFEILYAQLRTPNDLKQSNVNYPKDSDIDQYTSSNNSKVYVKDENGWHYRLPHEYKKQAKLFPDGNERVSFSGLPVKKLIDTLDQFVQGRAIYYKTPNQLAGWEERHDPITIYSKEPITPQLKSQLVSMLAPFSRNKYIPAKMDGDVFGDGLAHQRSPSEKEINNLAQMASSVAPELGNVLMRQFTRTDGSVKASAGQITAAKELIKLIQQTPQTPIQQQPGQQAAQQPGQQRISISGMEQQFGMQKGSLDLTPSQDGRYMFVRNRLTGNSLSVAPDVASIQQAIAKIK